MKNTIFVFATIYPKAENFARAQEILEGIIDDTRKEEGCIEFTLHKDDESKRLYLYEEWTDELAIEKHFTYEYMTSVIDEFLSLLDMQTHMVKMVNIK